MGCPTYRILAIQMYCPMIVIYMIVYTELKSIEKDLGIPLKTLFSVSNNLSSHYKKVKIAKKNGGTRELRVPDYILKKIQRAICDTFLVYEPISKYAQAYRFGSSVQKNASYHINKKKILKLDIKHFFDSILYTTVKDKCFPSDRFSEPIRILLSVLCYYGDALPQGAPSSPVITNIIMKDFDIEVGSFCEKRNISYTRYCDDMTFSGDFDEKEIISFVKEKLFSCGYLINNKKTTVVKEGKCQLVTGIVVNKRLSTPSEYKAKIRQEIYFGTKYGFENHLKHTGNQTELKSYIESLLGRVSFALQTEPDNNEFKKYKAQLIKYKKSIS